MIIYIIDNEDNDICRRKSVLSNFNILLIYIICHKTKTSSCLLLFKN